jgi:hypothetical protein
LLIDEIALRLAGSCGAITGSQHLFSRSENALPGDGAVVCGDLMKALRTAKEPEANAELQREQQQGQHCQHCQDRHGGGGAGGHG